MSKTVAQELIEYGLDEEVVMEMIDVMSIAVGASRDQWMCSGCFADGGYDMPETCPCPNGCGRCYCQDCLVKRGYICRCGYFMEEEVNNQSTDDKSQ